MSESTAALVDAPQPDPEHIRLILRAAARRTRVLYTPRVIERAALMLGSIADLVAAHGVELAQLAESVDVAGAALDRVTAAVLDTPPALDPRALVEHLADRVELAGELVSLPTIGGPWGARLVVERSCSTPQWGPRGDGDLWIGLRRMQAPGRTWTWIAAPDTRMTSTLTIAAELTPTGAEQVAAAAVQIITGQLGDPFAASPRISFIIPAQRRS